MHFSSAGERNQDARRCGYQEQRLVSDYLAFLIDEKYEKAIFGMNTNAYSLFLLQLL